MRKLTLFLALGMTVIFSFSANAAKQVYTTYDPDGGHILTYWYDEDFSSWPDVNKPELYNPSSATQRFVGYAAKIKHAVIDKSMKDWKPTSLSQMFYGNASTNSLVNLEDITGWENLNTSNVMNMYEMFFACGKLKVIDMGSWDLAKVTNITHMFSDNPALTTIICDADFHELDCFPPSFRDCTNLVGAKGTNFDTGKTGLDYARPDKGTTAPGYFTPSTKSYTEYITDNDTLYYKYDNNWYYSENKIEIYRGKDDNRFSGYASKITVVLIDQSMKAWKPTSLRKFLCGGSGAPSDLTNLTEIIGLENVNTAEVTDLYMAFNDLRSLDTLNLSMWDMSKLELLSYAFTDCIKLKTLDIHTWQPTKLKNTGSMFKRCSLLETIYADYDWNGYTTLTSSADMFYDCPKLVGGAGTEFSADGAQDKSYARVDQGTSNPGYFTSTTQRATALSNLDNAYKDLTALDNNAVACDIEIGDRTPLEYAINNAGAVLMDNAASVKQIKEATTAADNAWTEQHAALLPIAKTNADNLKGEMLDLKDAISAKPFEEAGIANEIQKHILQLIEAQKKTTLAEVKEIYATGKDHFLADVGAALLAAKQWGKDMLDALAQPGDNAECQQIIADAKNDIEAITWDDTKSVADNISAIKTAANTIATNTQTALEAARKATAIDAVTGTPSHVTEKVFRNGQLLIIRDGILYNAQGAVVE